MRRSWNPLIWVGFAVTLAAAFSYVPIFVPIPATRDVPWVNLVLFLLGGGLLAAGIRRAYRDPARYRGKVSGAVLGVLTVTIFALFCWGNFVFARRVPSSSSAPRVGQQAPDFTLADIHGKPVSLSSLRAGHAAVLLIFYRGYW